MFWHKIFGQKKREYSCGRKQQGFTFIEIMISLLILTVGTLSMLEIVNLAMDVNQRSVQGIIANNLAAALMSEIMTKNFQENPKPAQDPIGPDPPAAPVENRYSTVPAILFDDVDDYNNFADNPPHTIDGTALANFGGFTRNVVVEFVFYNNAATPPAWETPVPPNTFQTNKRITVTVDGNRAHVVLTEIAAQPAGP